MAPIHVNGRDYEFIDGSDITMDEAVVIYEWTKMSVEQLSGLEGFHPGFVAALIQISIARSEPDEPAKVIRQMVGKLPYGDLNKIFMDNSREVDGTGGPLTGNEPSSPTADSGDTSSPTGEPSPASGPLNGSGSPGSATGATSDPKIWAA